MTWQALKKTSHGQLMPRIAIGVGDERNAGEIIVNLVCIPWFRQDSSEASLIS